MEENLSKLKFVKKTQNNETTKKQTVEQNLKTRYRNFLSNTLREKKSKGPSNSSLKKKTFGLPWISGFASVLNDHSLNYSTVNRDRDKINKQSRTSLPGSDSRQVFRGYKISKTKGTRIEE